MTVLQAQSECQPYWVIGPQRSALTSNDTILVQSRLGVYSSIAIILELSLNCKPSTLALLLLAWCLHILNPHTLLSVAACSYEQPFNANLHTSQISDTDRVEEADCSQWFVQRCILGPEGILGPSIEECQLSWWTITQFAGPCI